MPLPHRVPTVRRITAPILLALCALPSLSWGGQNDPAEPMPDKYKKWLEQEVVYIISDREKQAFQDLQSVEEWEAFIQAFWRRRDPDPLTPVNEFKEEHYRRLEHANKFLGRESAVPGWMTDRGQMYIILGEPDDRETFMSVPFLYPAEVWFYQADKQRSLPPLYLLFFQDNNAGPYRLFNHLLDQPEDLMPSQPLDPNNSRSEAYRLLQEISPDLAHASLTMKADEAPFANIVQPERAGLDFQLLLSDIYEAPFRRVDTSYVDAAKDARGVVEADYLFNYVPNQAVANLLPGPGGSRFVHYSIEIEPQHMTLAKDGNVYYTTFELRGEVTTMEGDDIILQFVKEPFLKLTESQFIDVGSRPFSYRDMFPIAAGDFRFRVVLKNRARSEYTIFETEIHVPERTDTPSLGKPVLLYGASELTDPETASLYRTYQLGSLRLDPNAKKAYVIGDNLVAHIPVENAGDEHQISLSLVGQEASSQQLANKSTRVGQYGGNPIVERFGLEGATGGRYRLVAELLAPSGATLATSSTDFDVTPRTSIQRPWTLRESINGEQIGLVRSALAEQYLKLGDPEKARKLYQEALRDDPNLGAPRLVLARIQLDEGQPVEAIKLLEPAYAQNKDNVQILLTLGDAHFQVKNYQRAAELYEATIILRSPNTGLFNALAVCFAQLGNHEKAIQYLERSLALDPNQEDVKTLMEELKKSSTSSPPRR